jgi:hypothetical protein
MKNKTIKIVGIGAAVLFVCLTLMPMAGARMDDFGIMRRTIAHEGSYT